jgi:hypothetical protein
MGPVQYIRHLISGARLPFTVAYFTSIALTLYFAVGVSYRLTRIIGHISYFPFRTGRSQIGCLESVSDERLVGFEAIFSNLRCQTVAANRPSRSQRLPLLFTLF